MKPIVLGLLLAAAGCSRSEVSFAFYTDPGRGLTQDLITVRFTDGLQTRTLSGRDFSTSMQSAVPRTDHLWTRGGGTLAAQVWLVRGGDTLVTGNVELPLREDWRWSVDIFVADSNPMKSCFGCQGSRAFKAIAGAPGDSLFLVWGGNSISHPVVY